MIHGVHPGPVISEGLCGGAADMLHGEGGTLHVKGGRHGTAREAAGPPEDPFRALGGNSFGS